MYANWSAHARVALLEHTELLAIAQAMRAAREAKDVLQTGDENSLLCNLANRLTSHRSVEEEVARCILAEDEISDNASAELNRIRRQMKIVGERVREKLNSMLKSATTQKYLQEAVITIRNGRYVLPVKAECRAQVPGLVHDQSSSGATLFIEPGAVVELGNENKRLLIEEKKRDRADLIRPYCDDRTVCRRDSHELQCDGRAGCDLCARDHGAGFSRRSSQAQRRRDKFASCAADTR
jgi:dsDNA-specific endonuclease/ATPase MutS2